MMQQPAPSARLSPFAGAPSPALPPDAEHFEIDFDAPEDARAQTRGPYPSAAPGPSLMSTAASDALRPLRGVGPSPQDARAAGMADILADFSRQHPDTRLTALVGADVGRLLGRNRWVVVPTAGLCLLGFLMGVGFTTQAGFNLLVPIRSEPFNPVGNDHRGEAAALVGWTLSAGIGAALGMAGPGRLLGALLQRRRGLDAQLPASPLADLLVAEASRLYHRHQPVVVWGSSATLACYLTCLGLGTQAGFNFLRNIPSPPFNPSGLANRTLAGVLLGWNLSAAILLGIPVGATCGVIVGRGFRRLQSQPANPAAQ